MKDVRIELTYNGLSKLFGELYKDSVDTIDIEFPPLTLEQFQKINLAASEFNYYIVDMNAGKTRTLLKFNSDEFFEDDWFDDETGEYYYGSIKGFEEWDDWEDEDDIVDLF